MEIYQLSDKEIQKIENYRRILKLPEEQYSDKEVLKIIEHTRWLAKMYINQFKKVSPKEFLKRMKLEYNENADKNRDGIAQRD